MITLEMPSDLVTLIVLVYIKVCLACAYLLCGVDTIRPQFIKIEINSHYSMM